MRCFIVFFGVFFYVSCLWGASNDILSPDDVDTYKTIFNMEEQGKYKEISQYITKIKNPLLMGYVLHGLYFSNGYKTSKKEITNWLEKYSDYPIATDIYALGRQKNIKNLPRPKGVFGGNTDACENLTRYEASDLTKGLTFRNNQERKIIRQFNKYLSRGNTLNAKNTLNNKENVKILSSYVLSRARTSLAFSYFLDGRDDLAWDQLERVLQHIKATPHTLAYWLAGLVHWRQKMYDQSAVFFEKTYNETNDLQLKAAAAFWTARSYLRLGHYSKVAPFLNEAAQNPRYFYGLLAIRSLGKDLNYVWQEPSNIDDTLTADFSHPALERFYALRQLGIDQWAIEELSKLYLEADEESRGLLWLISRENGFEETLKGMTGVLDGETIRFPMPNWIPQSNWQLDKALVYAFVRQESCFNHRAESSVGAIGLMQIMPKTAKEMARTLQCEYKTKNLKLPEYNLALGQEYIKKLLNLPNIQNNLIKLAVAYNAGPGNLKKWEQKMDYQDDPLLFLESIPSRETRRFVEKILVNYWVYQNLTNLPLSSLDEIVSGQWPMYQMCAK